MFLEKLRAKTIRQGSIGSQLPPRSELSSQQPASSHKHSISTAVSVKSGTESGEKKGKGIGFLNKLRLFRQVKAFSNDNVEQTQAVKLTQEAENGQKAISESGRVNQLLRFNGKVSEFNGIETVQNNDDSGRLDRSFRDETLERSNQSSDVDVQAQEVQNRKRRAVSQMRTMRASSITPDIQGGVRVRASCKQVGAELRTFTFDKRAESFGGGQNQSSFFAKRITNTEQNNSGIPQLFKIGAQIPDFFKPLDSIRDAPAFSARINNDEEFYGDWRNGIISQQTKGVSYSRISLLLYLNSLKQSGLSPLHIFKESTEQENQQLISQQHIVSVQKFKEALTQSGVDKMMSQPHFMDLFKLLDEREVGTFPVARFFDALDAFRVKGWYHSLFHEEEHFILSSEIHTFLEQTLAKLLFFMKEVIFQDGDNIYPEKLFLDCEPEKDGKLLYLSNFMWLIDEKSEREMFSLIEIEAISHFCGQYCVDQRDTTSAVFDQESFVKMINDLDKGTYLINNQKIDKFERIQVPKIQIEKEEEFSEKHIYGKLLEQLGQKIQSPKKAMKIMALQITTVQAVQKISQKFQEKESAKQVIKRPTLSLTRELSLSELISKIEEVISCSLQEALEPYFIFDSISSLALQRKMQFLSSNTLDRKLVAQLCSSFGSNSEGNIDVLDIVRVLAANGRSSCVQAAKKVLASIENSDLKEIKDHFLIQQCTLNRILLLKNFKNAILRITPELSPFEVLCLYFECTKKQGEENKCPQVQDVIDYLKSQQQETRINNKLKEDDKELTAQNSLNLYQIRQDKLQVIQRPQTPRKRIIFRQDSGRKSSLLTARPLQLENKSIIRNMIQEFIQQHKVLLNDFNLISGALTKASMIMKSFQTFQDAILIFAKNEDQIQATVSAELIDQVFSGYPIITQKERLLLSILPLTIQQNGSHTIDIVKYVKYLRSLTLTEQIVEQTRTMLGSKCKQLSIPTV